MAKGTQYWMLECSPPDEWDDCAILDMAPMPPGATSWLHGKRFPRPVREPLEFTMIEDHNDQLTELDKSEALVMTTRLHKALVAAGVDNLDAYKAVIRHATLPTVLKNYVACNLIGIVTAADLKKSTVVGGTGLIDTDFDSLTIDEKKTRNLLMFRLAESANGVVVHDKVKKHLIKSGFDMLSFVKPEEWIG